MPPRTDTTLAEDEAPPSEYTYSLRYEEGELRATMDPPLSKLEEGYSEWVFIPRRDDTFALGRRHRGELVEYGDWLSLEFVMEGGRAVGIEIRSPDDKLMESGRRIP